MHPTIAQIKETLTEIRDVFHLKMQVTTIECESVLVQTLQDIKSFQCYI